MSKEKSVIHISVVMNCYRYILYVESGHGWVNNYCGKIFNMSFPFSSRWTNISPFISVRLMKASSMRLSDGIAFQSRELLKFHISHIFNGNINIHIIEYALKNTLGYPRVYLALIILLF